MTSNPTWWQRVLVSVAASLALVPLAPFVTRAHGQDASKGRTIEVVRGPIVSGSRVVGLGGAFTGVADSADGHMINPASIAMRARHTAHEWFDWDFAFSFASFTGRDDVEVALTNTDIDYDRAGLLDLGINFKFGVHAFALHAFLHEFEVPPRVTGNRESIDVRTVTFGLGYGVTVLENQLSYGVMLAPVGLTVKTHEELFGPEPELVACSDTNARPATAPCARKFDATGVGGLLGVLWSPNRWPFRVGMTFRTPVSASGSEGELPAGFEDVPPARVEMPWQLGIGLSVLLFAENPLNPRASWDDDDDTAWAPALDPPESVPTPDDTSDGERESAPVIPVGVVERVEVADEEPERIPEDGPTLLIAADVVTTGTSDDAVSVASLVSQELESAGEFVTVAFHLGVESEVLPSWIRVRAGTYLEPARVAGIDPRPHVTGGVDVKVPVWWDWRVGAVVDWAPDYLNWGLGIGFWH